jgi:hypothetical protein
MFSFAALEVALGLVFVYLILSLACSALNETISSIFSWRAKFLRTGIANLLDPENHANGLSLVGQLYRHPLVNGMIRPFPPGGRDRYPSYIPSRTFVTAVLDFDASGAVVSVEHAIGKIPSEQARTALTTLLANAQGDVERFRLNAEEWFDDAMERVSGWYRRRLQLLTWALAAILVLSLNVDTIRIAQHLWTDNTVRAAVVARAEQAAETGGVDEVAERVDALDEIAIPIGWGSEERPTDAPDWLLTAFAKLLGLLLTAGALTLGAPFWFDMLSKIARIRSAGAPPPASGAIRRGEGEQEREGPGAEGDAPGETR